MSVLLTTAQINRQLLESSPFHNLFKIRVDSNDAQQAVCSMPLREDYFHAGGVLHGSITYALADTVVSILLLGQLGLQRKVFTIEGKLNYLASVPAGTQGAISAHARLIHLGRSTAVVDTDVFSDAQRLLCHGIFTYAIR